MADKWTKHKSPRNLLSSRMTIAAENTLDEEAEEDTVAGAVETTEEDGYKKTLL